MCIKRYIYKRIEEDDNILVGDIVYGSQGSDGGKQYYGLNLVSYDFIKKCKILNGNEGMPYASKEIIKLLRENKVTYDNIDEYRKQLPDFEFWDDFEYTRDNWLEE